MAIRKKPVAKPKPKYTVQNPMTKTTVRKVSPDLKLIVPGSKPRSQTATEKREIAERAKGRTPAAREAQRNRARYQKRQARGEATAARASAGNAAYEREMERRFGSNWYNQPKEKIGRGSEARRAAIKEQEAAKRLAKQKQAEKKPAQKAKRTAINRERGLERSRQIRASRGGGASLLGQPGRVIGVQKNRQEIQ